MPRDAVSVERKDLTMFLSIAFSLLRFFESQSLSSDSSGQLHVLGHDGDPLCMDGAHVCVLEESYKIGLRSLLQRQNCCTLKAKVGLEVTGNLSYQSLERQLPNEGIRCLLVLPDLPECYSTWSVPSWFLDTTTAKR